ncbi:MAG: hypothetical protein JW804_07225 [Sedimentisphaerales bacterium]|nr:hypothetical protein [Sedimentisphaerales bacterium]
MKKLLQGEALEKRAIELGCDIQGDPITRSSSGRHSRADDSKLQKRVIEAERSIRESRIWIFAFFSACASIISAITAIIAVISD